MALCGHWAGRHKFIAEVNSSMEQSASSASKVGRFGMDLLLLPTAALVGLAFAVRVLHLSALRGRLAMPLAYDDIVYFVDGLDLIEAEKKNGVASVIHPVLYDHAP